MAGRALVTGAAGFVGRTLCRALVERGWQVLGGVRAAADARSLPPEVDSVVLRDIGPKFVWPEGIGDVDAVFHLAARVHVMRETEGDPAEAFRRVNAEGTELLAAASARAGVRRFVYLSTVGVHGKRTTGGAFNEASPIAPHNDYAASKFEGEERLRRVAAGSGVESAVVRAPLVYGPGTPGNFLELLRWVERGVPLPLAGVANRRSLIYVGNLADFLVRCAADPQARGETFLVRDPADLSVPELIRHLAVLMERPARLFPFPSTILRTLARWAGKEAAVDRLTESLVIDDRHARDILGWQPPVAVKEGLRETVRWYRKEFARHE